MSAINELKIMIAHNDGSMFTILAKKNIYYLNSLEYENYKTQNMKTAIIYSLRLFKLLKFLINFSFVSLIFRTCQRVCRKYVKF